MDNELRELLWSYLLGQKTIDDVRMWVGANIWNAPSDQENMVDEVAIELSHIDAGHADTSYFRTQVLEILTSLGQPLPFFRAVAGLSEADDIVYLSVAFDLSLDCVVQNVTTTASESLVLR